jgi:hypothetical protein
MYMYYNMGAFQCVGNKVLMQNPAATSTIYGIITYGAGTANPVGGGPLIANNFIITGPNTTTNYSIYAYYLSEARIYNNTIINMSTYTSSCALRVYYSTTARVKNNILYCTGGAIPYFHYTSTSTTIAESNYNLLYTTGTSIGWWNNVDVGASLGAWQTASGMDANSKSKTVQFANTATGDLHLAGASMWDTELTGTMLADVPLDIDGDARVIPYIGADEACFIIGSDLSYALVDPQGNPRDYLEVPGTMYVQYHLGYPLAEAVALTVNLRLVDPYTNAIVWSTAFQANKPAGQALDGIAAVSVPSTIPPGAYRVEVSFNTKNSCGVYIDFPMPSSSVLVVPQGATPCQVWPGDVNNNGVVNYGDRSALNKYIQNANLSPTWIYGPRRYRPDAATNPLTYYTWVAQSSAPWATPDGCYMDVDGNGTVNGFDYIGIRINWLKSHGATPKDAPNALVPETFDMAQNYPNPFNPSTSLTLSVPEASTVQLVVTDMLGREVATLVNGTMQAGVHTVAFDARALPSGQYLATVRMTGNASGLGFSKVVTMTLAR